MSNSTLWRKTRAAKILFFREIVSIAIEFCTSKAALCPHRDRHVIGTACPDRGGGRSVPRAGSTFGMIKGIGRQHDLHRLRSWQQNSKITSSINDYMTVADRSRAEQCGAIKAHSTTVLSCTHRIAIGAAPGERGSLVLGVAPEDPLRNLECGPGAFDAVMPWAGGQSAVVTRIGAHG